MAYGLEVHNDITTYEIHAHQTSTGITAKIIFTFDASQVTTELQRDGIFQGFLTMMATMSDVTIDSAAKVGGYFTPVTP